MDINEACYGQEPAGSQLDSLREQIKNLQEKNDNQREIIEFQKGVIAKLEEMYAQLVPGNH